MRDNVNYEPRIEKTVWLGEPAVRFEAGGYEALLIPGIGAQVIALRDVARGLDLLRVPPDDIEAFRARPQVYGIPILYPPNRIEDGRFQTTQGVYEFPINDVKGNNHIHGFLRTRAWKITKMNVVPQRAVEIEAVFDGNRGTDVYARYLNEFEFRLEYSLSGAGLRQRISVTNKGENPLPMGLGFHTALKVPFHPDSKAEDYRLKVSVGEEWELTERILPTGKLLSLNEHDQNYRTQGVSPQGIPISGHYTVKELVLNGKPFHGAILEDKSKGLRLIYKVGKEYKQWMIWNDTADKGFICPEPQTWAINAPNLKLSPEVTGYKILRPGETWTEESCIYIEED